MQLYRYQSGSTLAIPKRGKKPEYTAFFLPPDHQGTNPDVCIAVDYLVRDAESIRQCADSFLGPEEPSNLLRSPAAADFACFALNRMDWQPTDDIPVALLKHQGITYDTNPKASQWYTTMVNSSFMDELQENMAKAHQKVVQHNQVVYGNPWVPLVIILVALAIIFWGLSLMS